MSDLYSQFRSYVKYLLSNIDYLTREERSEILSFIEYYANKAISRKFEHNFKID